MSLASLDCRVRRFASYSYTALLSKEGMACMFVAFVVLRVAAFFIIGPEAVKTIHIPPHL